MASWEHFGEIASVAQLTGVDAVKLIGLIVKAAGTAKMHKKNCRQFALHLKLIGNLLEQLKISELKRYSETREPLEHLEDALRRSFMLVQSCQDRSFLYMLAMGWNVVYQFRRAQNEIDQYLRLVPLITLVDNYRVRERLEVIQMDQREYTLDDEDQKVQHVILNPEPAVRDTTTMLKKTLSCSYPDLPFRDALKKESQKLQLELHQSQANLDVQQCQVIQHLLEVTEAISESSLPEESLSEKKSTKLEKTYSDVDEHNDDHYYVKEKSDKTSRNISTVSSGRDFLSHRESHRSHHSEEWHADLLGCCSEPGLCLKTLFCPCSTISKISTVATGRRMSTGDACNEVMAYSLVLSCCCYTCCIRGKLRKTLSITGGCIDDFLSHVMCCCCALVQEWREIKIRGMEGPMMTSTSPPTSQYMES